MSKPPFSPDTAIGEFISLSTHVSPTVVKTTGGDFLLTWRLEGLPFVGREEWELEHRHNTFNRMLQTLRAPDFVNVAFWVHDLRRRRAIKNASQFEHVFNQSLSDAYYRALSAQKLMQNELYLTMMYRPVVGGKRLVEKSSDLSRLEAEQQQAINKVHELAGNVEAVLKDCAPTRLGMYEAANGTVFSETLEFFGYLLNHIDEPVPVLQAPAYRYLAVTSKVFAVQGALDSALKRVASAPTIEALNTPVVQSTQTWDRTIEQQQQQHAALAQAQHAQHPMREQSPSRAYCGRGAREQVQMVLGDRLDFARHGGSELSVWLHRPAVAPTRRRRAQVGHLPELRAGARTSAGATIFRSHQMGRLYRLRATA